MSLWQGHGTSIRRVTRPQLPTYHADDNLSKLEILYDEPQEGAWFASLDPRLKNAPRRELSSGIANSALDIVLGYDRPDIVLLSDGHPILVLERSEEVPSGHNVGQRFARLVAALKADATGVYVFPFVAQKHGGITSGPRYVNLRLFQGMKAVEKVYRGSLIPICWPVDKDYEVMKTPAKDAPIKTLVSAFLDHVEQGGLPSVFGNNPEALKAWSTAAQFGKTIKRSKVYEAPPPSVEVLSTADAGAKFNILADDLKEFSEVVVYLIGMTYIRSDPYAGMAMLYDYLYCRSGGKQPNKALALYCPQVSLAEWKKAALAGNTNKTIRLFVEAADLLVFKNGYLRLR